MDIFMYANLPDYLNIKLAPLFSPFELNIFKSNQKCLMTPTILSTQYESTSNVQ